MTISITRATGTVELCTDLALQTEWESAVAELEQAQQSDDRDMLVTPQITAAAQKVRDLEAQMAHSTLVFTLQAMQRKTFNEHEAAHPPRENNDLDATFAVNTSTFFDAIMPETIIAVRRKDTDERVDFDPQTEWAALADEMSDGQYSAFALKAVTLNRGKVAAPFSQAASRLTQPSSETSASPFVSESRTSD